MPGGFGNFIFQLEGFEAQGAGLGRWANPHHADQFAGPLWLRGWDDGAAQCIARSSGPTMGSAMEERAESLYCPY